MPCQKLNGMIVCRSAGYYRLRLRDGGYVYMDWHRFCGPTFFRDRDSRRLINEWWENEAICAALDWFVKRGDRA